MTQFTVPAEMMNLILFPAENSVPSVAVPMFPETDPTTEKVATPDPPPRVHVIVQFSATVENGLTPTSDMMPFPALDPPATGLKVDGFRLTISSIKPLAISSHEMITLESSLMNCIPLTRMVAWRAYSFVPSGRRKPVKNFIL